MCETTGIVHQRVETDQVKVTGSLRVKSNSLISCHRAMVKTRPEDKETHVHMS